MLRTRKSTEESQRYGHSDQPSSSSTSPNKEWPHRTGRTSDIQCVSDDKKYGNSHFTHGDTEKMERYDEEMIHHERSTIQVISDDTVTNLPHLRRLPNEILECIIDHAAGLLIPHNSVCHNGRWFGFEQQRALYTCTLVNKQFHSVANRVLWQEPTLYVSRTHMQQLLDCLGATEKPLGQYIRRLVLLDTSCADSQYLRPMGQISDLEAFLNGTEDFTTKVSPLTSSSNLEYLPRRCPRLFTPEPNNNQTLGDTGRAIAHYCHHLTELSVTCGYDIMTSANLFQRNNIKKMVLWPHLEILRLDHAFDIDSTTFIDFIKSHPHLELIRLRDAHLTDASLDALTVFLPHLRQLLLDNASEFSSGALLRLIQHCQKLVLVELLKCKFMMTDLLETLDNDVHEVSLKENDIANIRRAQKTGKNVH
ncbi:hypothetical protein BCR42DRAFT_426069 [Absidia repens]|uniref:Uncharacterized protein n=1 Tax=Absidia repens TaxID=90262 RepID=A0A1X2I1B3_9FUNG|nr:hypothetical protein BCR42DRAFT_426069 [Absidia repens]